MYQHLHFTYKKELTLMDVAIICIFTSAMQYPIQYILCYSTGTSLRRKSCVVSNGYHVIESWGEGVTPWKLISLDFVNCIRLFWLIFCWTKWSKLRVVIPNGSFFGRFSLHSWMCRNIHIKTVWNKNKCSYICPWIGS